MFIIVPMENIDAIIYTKNLIQELENDDFFSLIDPFVEKEPLYNEILKMANENVTIFDEPTITGGQLSMAIDAVRRRSIAEAFDDLVEDGLINMDGLNKDGEFLYSLNDETREFLKKNKKSL
jgi:hypothetical protein